MSAALVNSAFAGLLLALSSFGAHKVTEREWLRKAGFGFCAAAWLVLTAFLALRWWESSHAPLSNQYESMMVLTWAFLGVQVLFARNLPVPHLGLWSALFALILFAVASLLDDSVRPLVPALQSNWLILHVSVTMAAYALFAFAFLAALLCLVLNPARHEATVSSFDGLNHRSISLGFVFLTVGIIFGSVWANEAWGSYWSWDPKETWSLVTWIVYAVALHLRKVRAWRGRRFAAVSAAGFASVAFTYFGVNYLLSGLHAYG